MNAYLMNNEMPSAPASTDDAATLAGGMPPGLSPGIGMGDTEPDSGNWCRGARGWVASLADPPTGRRPTCSLPARFTPGLMSLVAQFSSSGQLSWPFA